MLKVCYITAKSLCPKAYKKSNQMTKESKHEYRDGSNDGNPVQISSLTNILTRYCPAP